MVSPSLNASLIRPHLFVPVLSDFIINDQLCLEVDQGRFCVCYDDHLVKGWVVATNFGAEPTVPSFTIIVGVDGSV